VSHFECEFSGHKKRGMSTTEIYAPFDPTYLSQSVAAIDKLLEQLNSILMNDDNQFGHQPDIQSQEQQIETQTNVVPCQCGHDNSHAKAPLPCESRVKNSHGTEKRSGVNSLIEKEKLVGVRRIELRTSSMSRRYNLLKNIRKMRKMIQERIRNFKK